MCCSGLLKTIMCIFNGAICLVGAAILGVGIWVTVDAGSLQGFLDYNQDAPPELSQLGSVGYLLIVLGSVLTFIGFLGCCGAIKENRCMLATFFIVILLIFIAEAAGAAVLLVFQPQVEKLLEDIRERVAVSIKEHYGGPDDEAFTTFWNTTMDKLECCGYNNHTDFIDSPHVNMTQLFPIECCRKGIDCDVVQAAVDDKPGCIPKLVTLVEDNALIVGAFAMAVCGLEIAAMVVSMILFKKAGKND